MADKQPLQEGNVQTYTEGQAIKRIHPDANIHLDHIPSKQAIKEAYANIAGWDSTVKIDKMTKQKIDKITTVIARAHEGHAQSDTTGPRNRDLAKIDSRVLALAAVRDLEKYKQQELQNGKLTPEQIETAIEEVHQKNYNLDIYSPKEVTIAKEFSHELRNLDIRNDKGHIPTFEEIANRYDAKMGEVNSPKRFDEGHFNNRLAKPSIIVGATLVSMVFTEKSEASNIPTLHLNTHLDKDTFDTLSTNEQIGAEIGAGFNGINAVQAGEEFRTGASKSAATLLDKQAYKEGLEQTIKHVPEAVITREVVKLGAMDSAKFAGKSLLKKLPFIGLVAGIGFGISRALHGDWKGAGMEVASGAFSLIPGVGTAASVGMDAALLEKDTGLLSHGAQKLLSKDEEKTIVEHKDIHDKPMENDSMDICTATAIDLEKNGASTTVTTHSSEVSGKYGAIEVNTCTMDAHLIDRKEEDASVQLECQSVKITTDDSTEYYSQCKDSLTDNHTYNQEEVNQAAQRIYDGIAEKYGSNSHTEEEHYGFSPELNTYLDQFKAPDTMTDEHDRGGRE